MHVQNDLNLHILQITFSLDVAQMCLVLLTISRQFFSHLFVLVSVKCSLYRVYLFVLIDYGEIIH